MLKVSHRDDLIGTLSKRSGVISFEYADAWNGYPLHPNQIDQLKSADSYFDNLLPESKIRNDLAESLHVHETDSYALLSDLGRDVAGGFTVGTEIQSSNRYRDIPSGELSDLLALSKDGVPLVVSAGNKFSLAGAQDKMAIAYRDGNFYQPEDYAASTHILKPESQNPEYPFCPANEFFCMQLAENIGMRVPKTDLLTIGDYRAYLISRYDRKIINGDAIRLHQVDGCQILGRPKTDKYEDQGGIRFNDLYSKAGDICIDPGQTQSDMLDWVIFNYLIGNSDAHAKNLSFMVDKNGVSLAKWYDLVCVEVYHKDNRLSLGIGGEFQAGYVEGAHWDAFSLLLGFSPNITRKKLTDMIRKISSAAEKLQLATFLNPGESDLISQIKDVIKQRATFVQHSLKDTPLTKPGDFTGINSVMTIIDESIVEKIQKVNKFAQSKPF